jgi:hypothetical protein
MKMKKWGFRSMMPVLLFLLAANILSVFWHTGIDLTAEKRFTLSPATRELVAGIDEPMTLTVYLEGDIPAGFKKVAATAADMSAAFRSISNGRFQVVFERPGDGLDDSARTLLFDSLQRKGINGGGTRVQRESQRLAHRHAGGGGCDSTGGGGGRKGPAPAAAGPPACRSGCRTAAT